MEFKDYYATLGIASTASAAEVKAAYRKQARKFHPDVSKEPDAEARFKDITEANEALSDAEKRLAYDAVCATRLGGSGEFRPAPGWNSGFEFSGPGGGADPVHSDFFASLFGRRPRTGAGPTAGGDHHAKVQIELQDSYRGGRRTVTLRVPQSDAQGLMSLQTKQLSLSIPKGIRAGQHLRLSGQGGAGSGGGAAGDLYLEIEFAAHPQFRVDGRDVYLDLPVAPWEAALGAEMAVATPDGSVQMTVPSGAAAGLKLRLRGKGIPGEPPGDLYALLSIALPKADSEAGQQAYRAMAQSFAGFKPRPVAEGTSSP